MILRGHFFDPQFCLYNGDNKIGSACHTRLLGDSTGSACHTWLLGDSKRVKALYSLEPPSRGKLLSIRSFAISCSLPTPHALQEMLGEVFRSHSGSKALFYPDPPIHPHHLLNCLAPLLTRFPLPRMSLHQSSSPLSPQGHPAPPQVCSAFLPKP